ncbi:MAG: hypothetical protein Q8K81_09705 [Sulfuricurvum sp.]|nr:hypothetical protein [Sulfuricurvum sp.]
MKKFFLLLVSVASYSADLIHVSNDSTPKNLQMLSEKYQQILLINDDAVYLIPSECQSERYFGGASQGVLNLVQGPTRTETVLNTQEVFEAKNEKEIIKKIELEKTFAIAEGKVSKDFLEDKDGRGFGGASEMPLVIHNEIQSAVQEKSGLRDTKQIQRTSCQLLQDGSGYKIHSMSNGQLYFNGKFTFVVNDTVLFQ